MSKVSLRGITWNHSRALPPLVAASQRFEELHHDISIRWEKRSLDQFGHQSLAALAESYDLLIIDHPMLGEVHRDGILLDLQPRLRPEVLEDLKRDALGSCLESYRYKECLYALPVDAAAPAASYRPDLLDRHGCGVPTTWNEVLDLARRGFVGMPGFPADLFLNLMGMCASRGSSIALGDHLFERDIAKRCLEELRELASFMPATIYSLNPIALYEEMTSENGFAYCPCAYSYSNYSRPGFAANTLRFANPVTLSDGKLFRTVLGGTGIAVSAKCREASTALELCEYISGRNCQSHLYGICGGQPASAAAWHTSLLNEVSGGFFERTLSSIQEALVRPRYAGYIGLQGSAGVPVINYLRGETSLDGTIEHLDTLHRQSRPGLRIERERA